MDFDLVKFTLSPTLREFERCRKVDLIQIADFFNITVSKEGRKQVVKEELYARLVETGILPERSIAGGPEAETDGEVFDDVYSGNGKKPSQVDPMVTVRLRARS